MGVIKKILFRDDVLEKPSLRNFFLDMEENIHIHYRDLRIELSRGEFEDICDAFRKQSRELQDIIDRDGYQDGLLPNANREDVRIWTESRLKHDVKYHPQRISLEACSDGYHFHCRNYKFLFQEADFREIVRLFKNIDVDSPNAETYEEVLALLTANDIDFLLDFGSVPDEILAIAVARHHLNKVREIFSLIGFTREEQKDQICYQGARLRVLVKRDADRSALDYRRMRGYQKTERLVDFLYRNGINIDPNELNRIKCQVLDLYTALNAGQKLNVDTDLQSWLYLPANQQVIFPYSVQAQGGKESAAPLLKSWNQLLVNLHLWFIKPRKIRFSNAEQQTLKTQVTEVIQRQVATAAAVDKIFLMGSALRDDMGYYQVPFVHGPHVKLGSDVDILVEINPARETDIPPHWQLINNTCSNHCAIYHIAEIPMARGATEWAQAHPNLRLIPHLVDGYIFFPSRGHDEEKEAFLKKFGARLIYDRHRDGVVAQEGEEGKIARRIAETYALSQIIVEKMKVSTDNALYKVFAGEQDYILKLFKVAGNYHHNRVAEHTAYEEKLITQLAVRGVLTATTIPASPGADSAMEGFSALLFQRLHGEVQSRPEYPLEKICPALAKIHRVQMESPLDLQTRFSFEDLCNIWLPCFESYRTNPILGADITTLFDGLAPIAKQCSEASYRKELSESSIAVHNHGDVKPKNVIIDQQGNACFFDFNNAYHGPRMADIINGCFEFSLAEKYIHLADFARFDVFYTHYSASAPLTEQETNQLTRWIELCGLIAFIKEIRVFLETPAEELRRKRAMAIAGFVLSRTAKHR